MRSTSASETPTPMPTPTAAEKGERAPWDTDSPPATSRAGAPAPRVARVRSSWSAWARSTRRATVAASFGRGAIRGRPGYGLTPSSWTTRVAPETWLATQRT